MNEPQTPHDPPPRNGRSVLFVSNFEGTFAGSDRSLAGLLNGVSDQLAPVVICPGDPDGLRRHVSNPGRVRFLQEPFHTYPYTMRDLQESAPEGEHGRVVLSYLLANNLAVVERLIRIREDVRPDVVHSNTSTVVLGALIAACWNVPHVWHVRETLAVRSHAMRWWIAMMRTYADLVVVPSRAAAAPLGPGVMVVPDLFDVHGISLLANTGRERLARRLAAGPHDVVIAGAGVCTPAKGYDVLIRALRLVVDADRRDGKDRQLRLAIAGEIPDPGYRRHLEETAHDLGVAGRVHLLGHLPYDEVLALLAAAAVVAHPAALDDTLPAVPREAMVLGTPVVATDVGGLRELVEHEVTGLVCRPNDAEDLAASLRRLLDIPGLATDLARQAAASVLSDRRQREEVAVYTALYERLAAMPRPATPIRWQRSLQRRLGRAVFTLAEATRAKIFLAETVAARDQELESVKYVLAARDRELAAVYAALAEREKEITSLREALRSELGSDGDSPDGD